MKIIKDPLLKLLHPLKQASNNLLPRSDADYKRIGPACRLRAIRSTSRLWIIFQFGALMPSAENGALMH